MALGEIFEGKTLGLEDALVHFAEDTASDVRISHVLELFIQPDCTTLSYDKIFSSCLLV